MDQIRETNINLVNIVLKLNAIVSILEEKGVITGTEYRKSLARQVDAVKHQVELEMKNKEEIECETTEKIKDVEVAEYGYLYIDADDDNSTNRIMEVEIKEESMPEESIELK